MVQCVAKQRTYWYCPSCRQEMPDLLNVMMTTYQRRQAAHCSELLPPVTLSETMVASH